MNKFVMEGFTAQKGLWNLARENVLQDRGALPEVKRKCVNSGSVEAFDTFSQGEMSECNDIHVLPSFAVEVVGVGERCRILVGSSGRSVALLLCRVCLWFY